MKTFLHKDNKGGTEGASFFYSPGKRGFKISVPQSASEVDLRDHFLICAGAPSAFKTALMAGCGGTGMRSLY